MNERLDSIRKFAVGACFASMLANVIPHSSYDTLMVTEQRRQITRKINQLNADETIIRGDDYRRIIYAIKKGKLIAIAKEIPGINYDEKGIPVSEKTGRPNVPFAVGFGILTIILAGIPYATTLKNKLSESMAASAARRKEKKEQKEEEKASKEKEKDKGSWL
ncbi:MAG: hypothetical protein LBC64_02640 [Fibromonadaceae bacterium]|jgi:hypothetical protein|nr:hypothetical protein [Fibromonadaceae bacterium]